jgi:hypothetical protein
VSIDSGWLRPNNVVSLLLPHGIPPHYALTRVSGRRNLPSRCYGWKLKEFLFVFLQWLWSFCVCSKLASNPDNNMWNTSAGRSEAIIPEIWGFLSPNAMPALQHLWKVHSWSRRNHACRDVSSHERWAFPQTPWEKEGSNSKLTLLLRQLTEVHLLDPRIEQSALASWSEHPLLTACHLHCTIHTRNKYWAGLFKNIQAEINK